MYDTSLIRDALDNINDCLHEVSEWTSHISTVDDFVTSMNGMILLNAVCMKLFAIGEEIKNIDKRTNNTFLRSYPIIDWRKVMGMRDIIAHHYFEIDADVVVQTLLTDIPALQEVVQQMKSDLSKITTKK